MYEMYTLAQKLWPKIKRYVMFLNKLGLGAFVT